MKYFDDSKIKVLEYYAQSWSKPKWKLAYLKKKLGDRNPLNLEKKQRRINRKGHRNEVNESMDSYQ